jgi:RimJ/RimL family protein N-acetyltransferase
MSEPRVTLRRATLDDAARLLAWRNDPSARRWFMDTAPVPKRTHVAWLTRKLQDPGCRIYIAERGGKPVGQLRLEKRRNAAEVSVSLDRAARGQGVGAAILGRVAAMARRELSVEEVRAIVRPDNVASAIAFLKVGFRFRALATRAGRPAYVFARPTAPREKP